MVRSMRRGQWRAIVLGLVFGLLAVGVGATPSLAATTSFNATFTETTTPQACPPGVPAGAFCYTGSGTGPTTPPVPTDLNGTENFAGFVDRAMGSPTTRCAPDFNIVSIRTYAGTLFLTTQGSACPDPTDPTNPAKSVDNGTWRAFGGTGIFEGASGSGAVSTTGTFVSPTKITSVSTYSGMLTLRGEN